MAAGCPSAGRPRCDVKILFRGMESSARVQDFFLPIKKYFPLVEKIFSSPVEKTTVAKL